MEIGNLPVGVLISSCVAAGSSSTSYWIDPLTLEKVRLGWLPPCLVAVTVYEFAARASVTVTPSVGWNPNDCTFSIVEGYTDADIGLMAGA